MGILCSTSTVSHAPSERLAAALVQLCAREGLDASETTAVLAVALTWAPGRPRDPVPLLRAVAVPA